ncbi:hypothetical protein BD769DRAFT_1699488 [Suillus cothurnatus]|nr:hypothetical protein BD769DRAFT_1699488 [Suillus cothurnatus]
MSSASQSFPTPPSSTTTIISGRTCLTWISRKALSLRYEVAQSSQFRHVMFESLGPQQLFQWRPTPMHKSTHDRCPKWTLSADTTPSSQSASRTDIGRRLQLLQFRFSWTLPLERPRGSLGSIPPQIATPRLKPPDTRRYQNFRPGRYKHESRSARLAVVRDSIKHTHAKLEHITMIDHLEQLHNKLLVHQAALVDGWAAAMAHLGLTSKLSPGYLL